MRKGLEDWECCEREAQDVNEGRGWNRKDNTPDFYYESIQVVT